MTKRPPQSKPKLPRGKQGRTPGDGELNQATGEDFERQGLGVAPKE